MTDEEITAAIHKLVLLQGAAKKRTTEKEYERNRERTVNEISKKFK